MAVRVVRLGSPREPDEGLRIGTVRRPPRGVPKAQFASQGWYDVWMPELAPSPETVRLGRSAADARQWRAFERAYRREMAAPAPAHALALLAALSRQTNFSVGCYCEDATRCHRSLLAALLADAGAELADTAAPAAG